MERHGLSRRRTDDRGGTATDIYATRVGLGRPRDPDAITVRDPGGIAVATTEDEETQPDVAWRSTQFLVVWRRVEGSNDDIEFTQVTAAGAVPGPTYVATNDIGQESLPALSAAKGDTVGMVYQRADQPDVIRPFFRTVSAK